MKGTAIILRELVSKKFGKHSSKIILGDEFDTTQILSENHSEGSLYSNSKNYEVWGYSASTGFKEILPNYETYSSDANGSRNDENGWNFSEPKMLESLSEYCFLIIRSHGQYSDCNRKNEWDDVTVYKTPNTKKILSDLEESDLKRWESWIEN